MSKAIRLILAFGLLGLSGTVGLTVPSATAQSAQEAETGGKKAAETGDGNDLRAPEIGLINAQYPAPGLLTGGQPTREQLAEAAKAGYRTVINLRSERETADGEEAAEVEKLGMRYVALPIAGVDDLTGENAEALAKVLEDEAAYPVILHCGSGNRVGALLAIKASYFEGKESAEALAIGLGAGLTTLEPQVRRILGLPVNVEE